jgi:Tol biopolymer transport system component/serine/threonine protein kinase
MGEVYRARDERLGREVAIKVLPAEIASERERIGRLEQEARAASALNHPNIVTIHEFGSVDGTFFMAMELVDGKNLRELLAAGPVPLKKVLLIAQHLAGGLAAAHAEGIVHRDLKPENVMVTKGGLVKILDFGLAKLTLPGSGSGELSDIPTRPHHGTAPGTVLGTVGYMSPEQASGRPLDFRSDQFALGTILYELLTGKRAFQRDSAVETLAAIIREEPEPIPAVGPGGAIPSPFRWIVERCLSKDPEFRYASTFDLAQEIAGVIAHLSEISSPGVEGASAGAERRPTPLLSRLGVRAALAALAGLAVGMVVGPRSFRPPPAELPSIRSLTSSGDDADPAISRDGKMIAFVSGRSGRSRIWLKQLAGGAEVALTEGSDSSPRFSPDGASVLFTRTVDDRPALHRAEVLGGEPRKIVDDAVSGDWSPDGQRIVFVRVRRAKVRRSSVVGVAAADGAGAQILAEVSDRVLSHPRWSPDGRWIVATEVAAQAAEPDSILLISADGKERRSIRPALGRGRLSWLAWNGDGREVLYFQADAVTVFAGASGRVIAQELSSEKARTLFWTAATVNGLDVAGEGRILFDSSSMRGNLRETAIDGEAPVEKRGHWLTRGNSNDRQPRYSPDGKWVVFSSNRNGNLDLWKVETATGAIRRLTDDVAADWDPAFTGDGRNLVWSSNRSGHFEIWIADADGAGPRRLTDDGVDAENPSSTPDGNWIVYNSANPSKAGIWKIGRDGSGATRILGHETSLWPEVSPDGRYVSFQTATSPTSAAVDVVRLSDGVTLPRRILVSGWRAGRSRWRPGGGLAFVANDENGVNGVFIQDFDEARDTTGSRRPLAGFDPDFPAESFGFSPDGARVTVSGGERSSSLMVADSVAGIFPAEAPGGKGR